MKPIANKPFKILISVCLYEDHNCYFTILLFFYKRAVSFLMDLTYYSSNDRLIEPLSFIKWYKTFFNYFTTFFHLPFQSRFCVCCVSWSTKLELSWGQLFEVQLFETVSFRNLFEQTLKNGLYYLVGWLKIAILQ